MIRGALLKEITKMSIKYTVPKPLWAKIEKYLSKPNG